MRTLEENNIEYSNTCAQYGHAKFRTIKLEENYEKNKRDIANELNSLEQKIEKLAKEADQIRTEMLKAEKAQEKKIEGMPPYPANAETPETQPNV